MRLDIHFHCGDDAVLPTLLERLDRIMVTLADIQAAVAAETTVEQSVIALLGTLSTDLKNALAANDQTAIQAVIDSIDANSAALSAAVAANTPAAPPATAPEPAPGS